MIKYHEYPAFLISRIFRLFSYLAKFTKFVFTNIQSMLKSILFKKNITFRDK